MEFTARELAKLDARHRVYRRAYVTFDHLEPECRAHWREHGGWDPVALRRCKARCCDHVDGGLSIAYDICPYRHHMQEATMTSIKSTTLKPGYLVSLKTTITGGVSYSKVIVEQDRETEEGSLIARWETERKIADRREHEEAVKIRAKCRNSIVAVCTKSAFGLLCPETSINQLDDLVSKARELADEFNKRARLSRINIYALTGRIAADDAEAVRALNWEVRDLLTTIEDGVRRLDVKAIREAANKARDLGRVLSPSAQQQVNVAIVAAREAAKKIVKGGETAAVEVDLIALEAIKKSRTAFLDLDGASEIQTPVADGRAVDFAPDTVIKPAPHVAPQIEL